MWAPARRPSGAGRNPNAINASGISGNPATNGAPNGPAPLIQKSAHVNSNGARPTARLFNNTRQPHVPRENPIIPTANQNNPQHALRLNPPMIAPIPNSSISISQSLWLPRFPRNFKKHFFQVGLTESRNNFLRRSFRNDFPSL